MNPFRVTRRAGEEGVQTMSSPSQGPLMNQPDLGHELLFSEYEVKEEDLVREPTNDIAKETQTARAPSESPATEADELAHEMLLYGHEQVLRASDTGVLVAFAA